MDLRRTLAVTALCLVPVVAAGACAGDVTGTAIAVGESGGDTVGRQIDGNVVDLVLPPDGFPAGYPAVVVPGGAAARLAPGMIGFPNDATIEPAGCDAPVPDLTDGRAAHVVGTDAATQSTITASVVRTDRSLASYRDEIESCPDITLSNDVVTVRATRELGETPDVAADDAVTVTLDVGSGRGAATLESRSVLMIAQVGDIWVSAMFMTYTDASVDEVALRDVFDKAVERVDAA